MTAIHQQCRLLIGYALGRQASDIHLTLSGPKLSIALRTPAGLESLDQDLFGPDLFEYLRYLSGMDLCRPGSPQSREFSLDYGSLRVSCRFSVMKQEEQASGVIRLLLSDRRFDLRTLCSIRKAYEQFLRLCCCRHGLIIACGPTGSGKSTAVHALLHKIADTQAKKIVTLEDPVEIQEPDMLQIEVSETAGITYENGIAQLLRHDPDVLFIGECRSEYAARMTVRASLTGHLVFTTLHCGSAKECLLRLTDLGIPAKELKTILKGIIICRLVSNGNRKEGIYEIWNEEQIGALFESSRHARPAVSFSEYPHRKKDAANADGGN